MGPIYKKQGYSKSYFLQDIRTKRLLNILALKIKKDLRRRTSHITVLIALYLFFQTDVGTIIKINLLYVYIERF